LKEILRDVELEIEKRGITPEEVSETISSIPPLLNRRIIMGYASVAMVDRENQKISIEALRDAVKRFMADGRYRIISIFHSDAVVGRVLPKWTDPKTGKSYETEVDNVGWKVVVELRDDIELAEKVWDEIIKGNLRSFSVAGTSKKKHNETSTGNPFTEIDELDLLECTICSVPVNPMSMFQVLWEGKDRIAI
jgi:HK97 family phage prohead protease